MATTDTRTGFRLPWSTDRTASREASAVPVEELGAAAAVADVDDGAAPAPEPGDMSPQDASGEGVHGAEEEAVTILAPDAAPSLAQSNATAPAPDPVGTPDGAEAGAPEIATPPPVAGPQRRPTKFLADLTRAMQAAAEQARTSTLEQFRGDGTSVIEKIHASSATGATELRRHADDDVAAIKDWSKAEIARVREETERHIGARREQLEGQLERHAALVEHEIEKVRGRIGTFEIARGKFFDDLDGDEDPAVFAARAASLPEPPSFEDLDDDAMTALLREPGVGVPEAVVEEVVETDPIVPEQAVEAVEAAPEAVVEAAPEPVVDAVSVVDATIDVDDAEGGQEAVAEDTELDQDAAMTAIQASAEAASAEDPGEIAAEAAAETIDEADATADATADANADATADANAETSNENATEGAADVTAPDSAAPALQDPANDPRLAMLGLTPDFAAAEMAAVEMATAEIDDLPEIGDDALAARLSGLVPGDAPAAEETAVTTRVVVTGLVSVASIASFKRHLGRIAGVGHVGVSSGPDAEFVFAVSHDPAASLRDEIPTLPGFAARVTDASDGVIQVSAQDPRD
ncbi:MAG: hypothetical protein ABIG85_03950 [Chloroflexota bacterium]